MHDKYPFQAQPLPRPYGSLLPVCDGETMYLHHDKLYDMAVGQLNRLVAEHGLWNLGLEDLILQDLNLPASQANQVKNVAGCVYNHQLYFSGIKNCAAGSPANSLTGRIAEIYGSIQEFSRLFREAAEGLPGVGWVWLATEGLWDLHIVTTNNNETLPLNALFPIVTLDLWEHAYFLLHQFDKAAYVRDWFSRINWELADQRFTHARSVPQLHR